MFETTEQIIYRHPWTKKTLVGLIGGIYCAHKVLLLEDTWWHVVNGHGGHKYCALYMCLDPPSTLEKGALRNFV